MGFKGFVRQHDPETSENTASATEPGTELRALEVFLLFFNAEFGSKVWVGRGEHCLWI